MTTNKTAMPDEIWAANESLYSAIHHYGHWESALDCFDPAVTTVKYIRADLVNNKPATSPNLAQVRAALEKIDNWLVCHPIAPPEDMAQSFPDMQKTASEALRILDTMPTKGEK